MFSKIWKDPVGSKVISVGVISIISLAYAKGQEMIKGISFADTYRKLLDYEISVSHLVVAILIYAITKQAIGTIFSGPSQRTEYPVDIAKKQLKTFNRIEDTEAQILFRWDVYFDDTNKPFIADLTAYCKRHSETPLRFMANCCPIHSCPNHNYPFDVHRAENHIESTLIAEWDKISPYNTNIL